MFYPQLTLSLQVLMAFQRLDLSGHMLRRNHLERVWEVCHGKRGMELIGFGLWGYCKVRETKANILVRHYELFKIMDNEDTKAIFARFQTLVHCLKVLNKSYTITDYVKKILRSLPKQWRPKITAIQEAKDLNTVKSEDLLSWLRVHELELNEEEPEKKTKWVAL